MRTASCSCGRLTAIATGDPIRVSVCHCHACQLRTGSVFGAQARFERKDVQTNGRSTQYVRVGDEGSRVTFNFCPECGATVHWQIAGWEEMIAIPVGAVADTEFPPPMFSVYEDRMHAWVGLPEHMEHMR